MTSAAVTGANGHIGNVICRELSGQGIDTRAIIHHRSDALSSVAIKRVVADIEDLQHLIKTFSGVDTVFHLAARISLNPRQAAATQKINWQGTRNVIEACRQVKVETLVYFSSIHVLDPDPQHETMDEHRAYSLESNLAYEVSKMRAELDVLQVKDFRVVVILPTSVIGPFDFGPSLMGQAIRKIYNSALPAILPYGFNWVDVRDVAMGSIEAARNGISGSRFILSGHYETLPGLVDIIREFNANVKKPFLCPPSLAYTMIPIYSQIMYALGKEPLYNKTSLDILRTAPIKISSQKAERELGYTPRALRSTIWDTLEWMNSQNSSK